MQIKASMVFYCSALNSCHALTLTPHPGKHPPRTHTHTLRINNICNYICSWKLSTLLAFTTVHVQYSGERGHIKSTDFLYLYSFSYLAIPSATLCQRLVTVSSCSHTIKSNTHCLEGQKLWQIPWILRNCDGSVICSWGMFWIYGKQSLDQK